MAVPFLQEANVAAAAYHVWFLPNNPGGTDTFTHVGEIDADGIRIRRSLSGEEITVNSLGEEFPVDFLYTGERYFLDLTLKEINRVAAKSLAFAHLDLAGNNTADLGGYPGLDNANYDMDEGMARSPGQLAVPNWAFELRLAPLLAGVVPSITNHNTAASLQDNIRWYKCCIPSPNNETAYALKMGLQTIPVSLQVLPYQTGVTQPEGNPTAPYSWRFWEYTSKISAQ